MKNLNKAKSETKNFEFVDNQIKFKPMNLKPKTFLLATLCAAAVLFSCGGDEPVTPKVEADFTFESGTERAVTFKNTSKNATSYAWDFGDGNTSKDENPTHTYSKDSTYTVTLTATNAGGSATKTATLTVTLAGASIQVVANFTFEADSETAGKVTFKNTSENATSYAWDFGDGNKSTDENPTHTYAKDGTYTVKLTATNEGKSADKTATINLKGSSIQVVASFTFTEGTKGGTVIFTNTSENAIGYTWDFGDGNTSIEENPTHTYGENNTYTVKLTVTNAGKSADTTQTVTITNIRLIPNFTFTKGTEGTVTFTNTSENANSYAWDFGDGNTSTDENPTHTYAKNDTYTVKLTATNKDGSADTTQTVTIDNALITIAIADLSQLVIPENSPKETLIGEIAATVTNTKETPVYSITSQNPAGAVGIEGNKMVVKDSSAFDYETNTEITGEIQGTIGSVTATATFTISITDDSDEGIYIPDANFKSYLVNNSAINTNGDQRISVAEARAYTGRIGAGNQGIKDATGIEYFSKITRLDLSTNALTKIDISQNTSLTFLSLSGNQLTALDVSNNTALTELYAYFNQLTVLNFSKNTALTSLWLYNNPLTCVQVDKLPIPSGWKFDQGKGSVFQTEACN